MASKELPTGTITFLFTDIEGSTQLFEQSPDSASVALVRHDAIIERDAAAFSGFVVRPRGEGDSRFIVFEHARDAVAAAVGIQQDLNAESWDTPWPLMVRRAMHTGEADLRQGDYYGSAVNRCARLRGIANGGQTLLSESTWALVQEALPAGVTFEDEGEHRLKDLARPEHVYQLVIPNLPNEFPPLKSLSVIPNNLPAQVTEFIGRQAELKETQRLLQQTRLLTLVGPGGIGKTRLAIQVAADQLAAFHDGVYFVSLAPLAEEDQIVQAVVETLSISFSSGHDLSAHLLNYLRRRRLMLVLDNFEHILEAAPLLTDILKAAPDVTILATSREKLNLSGETVFNVSGLGVADWQSPEELLVHSCGELFVQSAQRAYPDFELRIDDVRPVAQICRLVEGMPLGILLAAVWVDQLTAQEIAAEISQSLDFLETEMRDVPARQRSIRAVFETSWERLSRGERELFKKLSVFRGGFTRQAAREVAGSSLRALARLVNKSFLRPDPDTGRYEVHELLRQYGQEQLDAEANASDSAMQAHATYFARFVVSQAKNLRVGNKQRASLDNIQSDLENVRVAARYMAAQNDAPELQKILDSLWILHEIRGWYHAFLELLDESEASFQSARDDKETQAVIAQLQALRGFFMTTLGFPDQGLALARQSAATLRDLQRRDTLFLALQTQTISALNLFKIPEMSEAAQEMVTTSREIEDRWWEEQGFCYLSMSKIAAQELEEAGRYADAADALIKEFGDSWVAYWTGIVLALLATAQGEHVEARERYLLVLETARTLDYRRGIQFAAFSLGQASAMLGAADEAEDYYLQSLAISDEIGQTREMLTTLCDLARVWAKAGRSGEALELVAFILQHPAREQHAPLRPSSIQDDAGQVRAELEAVLSPQDYRNAWERGKRRELESVADEVLAAGVRQHRG